MHTKDFDEWRREMMPIRPYEQVSSGQVAHFRLELTLNDVGKAFYKKLDLTGYRLPQAYRAP